MVSGSSRFSGLFWTPRGQHQTETRVDSSGQAFEEWSIPANSKLSSPNKATAWFKKTLGSKEHVGRRLNPIGADSLQDMTLRVLLVNLEHLDRSNLLSLPHHMIVRLWTIIKQNNCDSLKNWQVFAKHLGPDIVQNRLKPLLVFKAPSIRLGLGGSLTHYFPYMSSTSMDWLTVLTINDHQPVNRSEWLAMSSIKNLASLYITCAYQGVAFLDDVVLQSWSMAAEQGAFKSLRFLLITNTEAFKTNLLLQLDIMPRLKVVAFNATTISHPNWMRYEDSTLCKRLKLAGIAKNHNALSMLQIIQSEDIEADREYSPPILSAFNQCDEEPYHRRDPIVLPHWSTVEWFERRDRPYIPMIPQYVPENSNVPIGKRIRSNTTASSGPTSKRVLIRDSKMKDSSKMLEDLMK